MDQIHVEIKEDLDPHLDSMDLAQAYFKQGITQSIVFQNYQRGVQSFTKSIEIDAYNPIAYYNRGYAYMKLNNIKFAISDFKEAVSMNDSLKEAYLNLGKCYSKSHQEELAIEAYNNALKIDPEYSSAFYNMGISYEDLGNLEKAILNYDKAIDLNPDRSSFYFNRAIIREKQQDPAAAILDYSKIVELGKADAGVYFSIGFNHLNLGQKELALRAFNNSIDRDSTFYDAYFNRALLFLENLEFEKGLSDLETFTSKHQNDPLAYFYMGKAYYEIARNYEALESFKKSIEYDDQFGWAYYYTGYIMINKFGQMEGCTYLQGALERGVSEAQNAINIVCNN